MGQGNSASPSKHDSNPSSPRASRGRPGLIASSVSVSGDSDTAEQSIADASPVAVSQECWIHITPTGAKRRKLNHVVVPGPAFPSSAFRTTDGKTVEAINEAEAIWALGRVHDSVHARDTIAPDDIYFDLNDFCIYLPRHEEHLRDRHSGGLVTLDRLQNRRGFNLFLLDGTLSCGTLEHRVQHVPFETLAIDGYGDTDTFSLAGRVCLQSLHCAKTNIWFRLGEPAAEYRRFYEPFLWLAQFAKCFAEYLLQTEHVTLRHFQRDAQFPQWLQRQYGGDDNYCKWWAQAQLWDYCTTVAANVGFLRKECWSLYDATAAAEKGLCDHPIWGEVDPERLTAIPREISIEVKTVVTPWAFECFKDMYFADQLKCMGFRNEPVRRQIARRKATMNMSPFQQHLPSGIRTPQSMPSPSPNKLLCIAEGDVVSVHADKGGPWQSSDSVWYVYVQAVRPSEQHVQLLDVLWLYKPCDTTLGAAFYPYENELFLSDNCNCGREALPLNVVIDKVDVEWHVTDPTRVSTLFVRQRFRTVHEHDSYSFETLKNSDFSCCCQHWSSDWDNCLRKYEIGETVLVLRGNEASSAHLNGSAIEPTDSDGCYKEEQEPTHRQELEPAQIVAFDYATERIELRRLTRKRAASTPPGPPNELILSEEVYSGAPDAIIRKCNIRYFTEAEYKEARIPTPYDQAGSVDCYVVLTDFTSPRSREVQHPLGSNPTTDLPPLKLGWDPETPIQKMKGLGIFCGGGNLDRGIEDGGAVECIHAVDWSDTALHSYRANSRNENIRCFLGSVDDYLAAVLSGSNKLNIARIGHIDVVLAGSPCPGFSSLQIDQLSDGSKRNASKVASVISFVDIYSPSYLVFENVVSMTRGLGESKKENVFAQVLAALVGLGYQVQQLLGDAWSYGSSQQRSRLFIVAAAPGMRPLEPLGHTHDHPGNGLFRERALGKSSNGKPFGIRRNDCTPFQHVSISQACKDLPDISDAQVQLCPSFPDHRTPTGESADSRTRIACVPVRPAGMGLVQAVATGYITGGEPLEFFCRLGKLQKSRRSTTYMRLNPDRLIPTLTTASRHYDGFSGGTLHWREHRGLTVQEAKRAQGYRDWEVIIGTPSQQWKIIGNSVDRKMALALGMSIRGAWTASLESEAVATTEAESAHCEADSDLAPSEQAVAYDTPTSDDTVVVSLRSRGSVDNLALTPPRTPMRRLDRESTSSTLASEDSTSEQGEDPETWALAHRDQWRDYRGTRRRMVEAVYVSPTSQDGE